MPKLKVIFEDDQILVIDKSAGIVVTPADTTLDETISEILKSEFGIELDRGGVVHRLDKDTSGVLIVAKTQESLENLQAQFKERLTKKQYVALVHGVLNSEEIVKGSISRNPANREKFIVLENDDSKPAETRFIPVRQLTMNEEQVGKVFVGFNKIQLRKIYSSHYQDFTLVDCSPLTGRTHQIRVHLKHIGFPIVSDEKYGGRKTVRLDRRWCPRQFLHAARLELNHPKTGERVSFESPLPEDLQEALKFLN